MENLKIKVDKKSDVDLVVGMLVELGFELESSNVVRVGMVGTFENHIYSDYLSHFDGFDYTGKEITIDQLRDMVVLKRNDSGDATHTDQDNWKWYIGEKSYCWERVGGNPMMWVEESTDHADLKPIKEKTMKEYLDPDNEYALILADDDTKSDQWIEVPEGAAVYGRNKLSGMREFYRNGKSIHIDRWSNGKWIESDYHVGNIDNIWCRKMQDKLDELKSSQKEKPQEKCADICGDVGENDVQSTLAERELQYGSFSDVAETTQAIIDALKLGKYDDMPSTHKVSLQMIASKMARITHGDFNFIESWHDISGYAKLIENELINTDGSTSSRVVYQIVKNGVLEDKNES